MKKALKIVFNPWLVTGILMVTLFSLIVLQVKDKFTEDSAANIQEAIAEKEEIPATWWNLASPYRKQIEIKNESGKELKASELVAFEIDHKTLVSEKKSTTDATDLHVIYFADNKSSEVPFAVNNPNTDRTEIVIQLSDSIKKKNSTERYYVYYGNLSSNMPAAKLANANDKKDNAKVTLKDEINYLVNGKTDRKWVLKDINSDPEAEKIAFDITLNDQLENVQSYEYKITEKNVSKAQGRLVNNKVTINSKDLEPGTYDIQAVIKIEDREYKSPKSTFYVSYPLYVIWSIDWEGWNVNQVNMDDMYEFSSTHSMPLTHMYHPRVHMDGYLSEAEQKRMSDWIKMDANDNDAEIALHLHMFDDFVLASGVEEIIDDPSWGMTEAQLSYGKGRDTPCSNYSQADFEKILDYSLKLFEQEGLPKPFAFRGGGWFADLETIAALESKGILIETSGRDKYYRGLNQIPGHWDLNSTTRPYQISKKNQNTTSAAANGNFDVWQFPNNGMTTTLKQFPQEDLVQRFWDNYNKTPLDKAQVLTYLSHAQWFTNTDKEKAHFVMDELDKYTFEADNGPLIYSTNTAVYENWVKE